MSSPVIARMCRLRAVGAYFGSRTGASWITWWAMAAVLCDVSGSPVLLAISGEANGTIVDNGKPE
jgi:hypothetical protein